MDVGRVGVGDEGYEAIKWAFVSCYRGNRLD